MAHSEVASHMQVRQAGASDAHRCADILNAWIDATDWMPRVHDHREVQRHYRDDVVQRRQVFVLDDPVAAFMALSDDNYVTALYSARPGTGLGKVLLDHAKASRLSLRLWTFEANLRAQSFYRREGFREVRRTQDDNEEGLPDILFEWRVT